MKRRMVPCGQMDLLKAAGIEITLILGKKLKKFDYLNPRKTQSVELFASFNSVLTFLGIFDSFKT